MPNVTYFDSTMTGAPALDNVAGSLITVLNACLVTGFTPFTLDSLVIADDVATASYSSGHGLAMVGNTGPVIRIADATLPALNGDWRVTVVSGTVFTFATSGIADQTALGTITARRAPAGFSKPFEGTNKVAYRSDDITGSRLYCRIDDSTTTYARIRGYEAMSDVDTGTDPFPTDAQISGGGYVYKANGTNRPWALYSDGRMVYFFCDPSGSNAWAGGFVFGDVDSYVSADAYGCLLGYSAGSSNDFLFAELASVSNSVLSRASNQITQSILSARYSHGKCTALGAGGSAYGITNLHLWPVEAWDTTTQPRGLLPGLWCPVHAGDTPHRLIVEAIPQLPGRTVLVQTTRSASCECALDLTGPWR